MDSNDYSTGDVEYIEDEYPEYAYDASDMEYIMNRRDSNPGIYKNTLYPQIEEYNSNSSRFSIFNRINKRNKDKGLYPTDLYNYQKPSLFDRLQPFLSNPFITVFLVVVISYLLSYFFGNILKIDYGISGLIEMVVALILSYGLTFMFVDRSRLFVTRGTVIFFISLIILIILVFI